MLVTSTPDGPATHTPTDTTPPTTVKSTANTDKVNALPPLTKDHKHSLTNAEDRSLLQRHFKMATQ